MIDWITSTAIWWTTGWIGLFLYWIPAALCVVGYAVMSVGEYQRDVKARAEAYKNEEDKKYRYYRPSLTVGALLWRSLISFVPVANLLVLIFDVLSEYFELAWKFLSIPLVPDRK